MIKRAGGVLMHISSLPGKYGIGCLGEYSRKFVDFLRDSGQSYWQVLPLGHTGFGNSPYQCFSAFAGNPYFIDLDDLCEQGLLYRHELDGADFGDSPDFIDYGKLYENRFPLLKTAFLRAGHTFDSRLDKFRRDNSYWLPEYSFFMAAKDYFGGQPVWLWEDQKLKRRDPETMNKYRRKLAEQIAFYEFIQYIFFSQWAKLKNYANQNGIKIIGDISFYVAADSSDVYSNPELFKLNSDLTPAFVAGVPPDYYSQSGQLWGNPVYDWKKHEQTGYEWWLSRIRHGFCCYDIIRIDHFRGFKKYWEIPAGSADATTGVWKNGPAMNLFSLIQQQFGQDNIIAEDLGMISPDVRAFLKKCGYPGMKVMVFAFDGTNRNNEHMPHCLPQNVVAYTSTHDSPPFCAVLNTLLPDARAQAVRYIRAANENSLGLDAINSLWASPATLAMTAMQDILSLHDDATMNRPSVPGDNWRWRVRADALNSHMSSIMRDITLTYGRLPE